MRPHHAYLREKRSEKYLKDSLNFYMYIYRNEVNGNGLFIYSFVCLFINFFMSYSFSQFVEVPITVKDSPHELHPD